MMSTLLNEDQQQQVVRQAEKIYRQRKENRRKKTSKKQKRVATLALSFLLLVTATSKSNYLSLSNAYILDDRLSDVQQGEPALDSADAALTFDETNSAPNVKEPPDAGESSLEFAVPAVQTDFKAFMDYRTITSRSSTQWQMQQEAVTNAEGFRLWNGYYMVAMGTYYAPFCGRIFSITLSSGRVFQCVVADIKADRDTDENHQHRNGNVVEFIVDGDHIPNVCWQMGDMSWAPDAGLRGTIEKIELINSPY